MTHTETQLIPLGLIHMDGGTQSRAKLDDTTIADYAEAMKEGAAFPPVTLFYDGEKYWLADGFHRVRAAGRIGALDIPADVRQGDQRAARLFSVGANGSHGLRRTNADKRRAVQVLLDDAEWREWSDHEIARRCAVGHDLVRGLRKSLALNASEKAPSATGADTITPSDSNGSSEGRTYTNRHGKQAKMKTGKIGKKKPVAPSPTTPPEPEPRHGPTLQELRDATPLEKALGRFHTDLAREFFQAYPQIPLAQWSTIAARLKERMERVLREFHIDHQQSSGCAATENEG